MSIRMRMTPRRRPVPADAHRLIEDSVNSVGALDLLLLVRDEPERWWTAEEVSDHLHCPVGWAATELESLRTGGLLEADGDRGYLFRPANTRLARAVEALADAYAEQASEVIRLIFTGGATRRTGGRRSRPNP